MEERKKLLQFTSSTGRNAIFNACLAGHDSCVELLIRYGADPANCDAYRDTPLHAAVKQKHILCVHVLLVAGADPAIANHRDQTPMSIAAGQDEQNESSKDGEIAQLLFFAGACGRLLC